MNNLLEKLKGSLPGDQSGWETASQRKQRRQTFFLVIFKHLLYSWKWWHDIHFGTAAVNWSWWCLWFPSALLLLWEYCKQEQVPLLPSFHLPGGICIAATTSPAFISQGWPSPALLTSSSPSLVVPLAPYHGREVTLHKRKNSHHCHLSAPRGQQNRVTRISFKNKLWTKGKSLFHSTKQHPITVLPQNNFLPSQTFNYVARTDTV